MPIIVYQALMFVSPGLTPREKRWVYGVVLGAFAFFLGGVAFAYYVALPPALALLPHPAGQGDAVLPGLLRREPLLGTRCLRRPQRHQPNPH